MFPQPKSAPSPFRRKPRPIEARHIDLIGNAFQASELHVRWAISQAVEKLRDAEVAAELVANVEIVLAELLNNIVEHAYSGQNEGEIYLSVVFEAGCVLVATKDKGREMPGLSPPDPCPPNLDVSRDALPEGQFGWFIIQNLTHELTYARVGIENHLSLKIG